MGGLLSRIRGGGSAGSGGGDLTTQYSTELLRLESSIEALKQRKQHNLSLKRRMSRALLLYGSLIWLLLLGVLYVVEFPNRTHVVAKCLRIGPLVAWPIILFLLQKGLHSYFDLQFRKTDAALMKLEKSQESKLEELIARTNFKETQKLISHFSEKKKPPPSAQQQQQQQQQQPNAQQIAQQRAAMMHQQQQMMASAAAGGRPPATPQGPGRAASQTMPATAFKNAQQQQAYMQQQQAWMQQQQQLQQQQQQGGQHATARPPNDTAALAARTPLDRLLDFVLNDGPGSKYALICKHCYGHNGLVQEQELGKLRYKCALCGTLNGPPMPPQQHAAAPGAAAAAASAGGLPPSTPASAHHNNSGRAPGAIPLTPFEPLPPTSEEEQGHARSRSATDSLAHAQEGHGASLADQLEEEGGADPAESPRRSSRVASRSSAGSSASSAGEAAAAAGSDSEGGEEASFVKVEPEEDGAPRKRRAQRAAK